MKSPVDHFILSVSQGPACSHSLISCCDSGWKPGGAWLCSPRCSCNRGRLGSWRVTPCPSKLLTAAWTEADAVITRLPIQCVFGQECLCMCQSLTSTVCLRPPLPDKSRVLLFTVQYIIILLPHKVCGYGQNRPCFMRESDFQSCDKRNECNTFKEARFCV